MVIWRYSRVAHAPLMTQGQDGIFGGNDERILRDVRSLRVHSFDEFAPLGRVLNWEGSSPLQCFNSVWAAQSFR
jgi:hypothetical protein